LLNCVIADEVLISYQQQEMAVMRQRLDQQVRDVTLRLLFCTAGGGSVDVGSL
jgi:predicted RNA polymerase sigma factor